MITKASNFLDVSKPFKYSKELKVYYFRGRYLGCGRKIGEIQFRSTI
jgi:hypothetical protein